VHFLALAIADRERGKRRGKKEKETG